MSPMCKSGSWTQLKTRKPQMRRHISSSRCKASLSKRLYLWSSSRQLTKGFGTRCAPDFLAGTEFDTDSNNIQVPMDPAHVRSFLNTAVFGTFITKITIMHAYQTCIKRIVRFANSLQVWNRAGTFKILIRAPFRTLLNSHQTICRSFL